jgi:methylated-DNA-protein-cysteine methyltransferase-like protein
MSRAERAIIQKSYTKIYAVVRKIPRGRVMTYGQVATAAGYPRAARLVGTALRATQLNKIVVPWQRVVGQRGRNMAQIAIKDAVGGTMQKKLLMKEGVRFTPSDGIDLDWFGWTPRSR